MSRPTIRFELINENEKYDNFIYCPCHPNRETRPLRLQLENYLNTCSEINVSRLDVSRLDMMVKMVCNRRYPGLVSNIKISMQQFVVGLFNECPDMFRPMISKIKEMLGYKSEYLTINMRIKHEKKENYLIVSLYIKKEIVANPSELEYVFQQLEKVPDKIKDEVQEVKHTPFSEEDFPSLQKSKR
jgi:hypothetical protein